MRGKKGIEGGMWLWVIAAVVALLVLFIALIASGKTGVILSGILGIGKNATDTAQNCITDPNSPTCMYSQSGQAAGTTPSSTAPSSPTKPPATNNQGSPGILGGVKTG